MVEYAVVLASLIGYLLLALAVFLGTVVTVALVLLAYADEQ